MTKRHNYNQKRFPFAIGDTVGVAENARVLHWHREMEICHVKNGSGKYLINGKDYPFTKGDVFIINNDEIHLCYDDSGLIMQVLMFDPSFVWSAGSNIMDHEYLKPFMETGSNFCNKLDRQNDKMDLVISTLMEIEIEYREMRPGYELMIKSLFLKLMTLIIRHFKIYGENDNSVYVSPAVSKKIRQTIEYMELNFNKPLSIAVLADTAQMSPAYFCHNFKVLTGISPIDFIIRKRISMAGEMLKNTKSRILDIAGECGFNSISNFNHLFKAYAGASPGVYRKS